MKLRVTIAIALTIGVAALAALAQVTNTSDAVSQETALKPVKLMVVKPEERAVERNFFGKVVARRTVDLAFQVGGQIQEFPLTEGSLIRKGDLIGALDLRPFELSLEQARLQKEQADRTVERLRKLKGSTVSQVAIDDAETSAGLANIALENAEIALEDATLRAPFDALVASRSVENFTTISAGTPVIRLHDMSEIRVEIDVPEVMVQRANIADDIKIEARFPSSENSYPLTVRELRAETSAIGQTYSATFGMAPPDGFSVLPGSSVTVTATLHRDGSGVVVPVSAVVIDNDGSTHLFRYDPKGADAGTLTKVPVTLSPTEDGKAEVVSGIDVGDEIVLAGVNALEDGMQVRRFNGFGA